MSSQAPPVAPDSVQTDTDPTLANVDAFRNAIGTSFYDGGEWTQGVLVDDSFEFQTGEWRIQVRLQVGDNSSPPKIIFTVKDAQIDDGGLQLTVACAPGKEGGQHPGWTRQPGSPDWSTTIPIPGLNNIRTGPPAPPAGAYQELVLVGRG